MGLIKAAIGSISGTLKDQWKEAIRCDDMDNDTLMVKRTTPTGVISNGSTVIVGPGQCAVIYDNGRIVDASAEEGIYTFDSSSTPSLFAGQFGGMFKEMWQRFTYNGATAKEQAVYFFNIKEIIDNKFGTSTPIMYKDWGHPTMNARTNSFIPMSVNIRCYGTYTFKISDPFLFMQKLAGTADVYKKEEIETQLHAEIIASFANVMNSLGSDKYKIEAMDLQNKTDEIKQIMDEEVFDRSIRERGLQLVSFAVASVSFDAESQRKVDNYELGGDQYSQQGTLTGSYAEAIVDAANNSNGPASGMMGIGMMNMASGGAFGGITNQGNIEYMKPQSLQTEQSEVNTSSEEVKVDGVKCPNCGNTITGNFCMECGTKKPEQPQERFCSSCGAKANSNAKFCIECGSQL